MPSRFPISARSRLAMALALTILAGATPGQLAAAPGPDEGVDAPGTQAQPGAPRFPCDQKPIRVILSPDCKTLMAAVQKDGGLVWDIATGKVLQRLPYLHGEKSLAFTKDGKYLGANGVWDMGTGKFLPNVPGMFSAFIGNDRVLMTDNQDHAQTLLIALNTGKTIRTFPGRFVGLARDAKTVTTQIARPGENRTVVWDLATGKQQQELRVPILRCQHEGQLVLSQGTSAVSLHDLAAGQERTLEQSQRALFSEDQAIFSPDGTILAAADEEFLYLWDTTTGKVRHKMPLDAPVPPTVRIFGYGEWREVPLYPRFPTQMRFAPNGKWLATAFHRDNPVYLWDVATGKRVHKEAVGHTLAFSADGATLVTGTGQSVRFWETATGTAIGPVSSGSARPR